MFEEKILFLQRNIKAVIQIERVINEDLRGLFAEKNLRATKFIGEYNKFRDIAEIRKSTGGIKNHNFLELERSRREEQPMIKNSFSI